MINRTLLAFHPTPQPTWAKLIDFETTLPTAIEELMRQREQRAAEPGGRLMRRSWWTTSTGGACPLGARDPGAPANALGIRHILFAVEGIGDVLHRVRAHGAELVGEPVEYENSYRLCYLPGPEGIIIEPAEQIK